MKRIAQTLFALGLVASVPLFAGQDLIKAAKSGRLAEIQNRLLAGEKINEADENGWTPLMWAVYKHEVPAISLLLEKGANPAVQSTAAKYSHPTGSTAAAIAIEWDLVDAVEALEKGGCQAAKRYLDCLKSIYFIDPQTEKRPFRIMNLITITQSNGYDESVMKSLKIKACQAGADGLTIPERQMGPRNTTYTTKVIVWEKVQP